MSEALDQRTMDTVMERMRKIRAMTVENGATEGEASNASAILSNLLMEYGLELAILDKDQRPESGASRINKFAIDFGTSQFKWKPALVRMVAYHNEVRIYSENMKKGKIVGMELLGRKINVEATVMMVEWLFSQIKALGTAQYKEYNRTHSSWEHIDPLKWHISFATGVVERLQLRLRMERENMTATSDVQSVVISVNADIEDWFDEQYPGRKERQAAYDERRKAQQETEAKFREEHPDEWAAQQKAKQEKADKENAEYARRYDARERSYFKRHGYHSWEKPIKTNIDERGRQSGYATAERINLHPFIEGEPTPAGNLR